MLTREGFEILAIDEGYRITRDELIGYTNPDTQARWESYQGSRLKIAQRFQPDPILWHPGSDKPHDRGYYARLYIGGISNDWWDGKQWRWGENGCVCGSQHRHWTIGTGVRLNGKKAD